MFKLYLTQNKNSINIYGKGKLGKIFMWGIPLAKIIEIFKWSILNYLDFLKFVRGPLALPKQGFVFTHILASISVRKTI